uniref:Glycosyltransferase involved in cell wall bisynthesis n=1 Tax=Candidatus Kentrum sp. UNK TaxID=2126344 RepID=A0A451ACJ0_9GAMM|nr:MAG: Glycosyltransferase involved in cell wall bisynthesis [Candidatus Kentron sp. UNK]VFK70934.1 MAG: Glycosyltransferase involved in cell wall bisynthesis [Candidatus Kentron sp. UNK]
MNICIVIPAYNEEKAVGETVREYRDAFPEARIVVIDNNSNDGTAEEARAMLNPQRDLLLTEKRQGKGFAVKSGLSRLEADIYVMIDGDATYPTDDARRLVDEMLDTRVDMVVGDRISGGTYTAQNTRPGHGWGNSMLTYIISNLAGRHFNDVLSGMRIMSRPFVTAFDVRSSGFQLETEMNVIAAYLRADVREIPISYRARPDGSDSKLSTIRDGLRIFHFALANWITFAPMQPFLILASVMSVISGVLGYRVIAGFLETGWPYTTTAIAAGASGLVAILAFFFGLSLKIISRNDRRREITHLLEAKRQWNTRLDAKNL